MLGRMFRRPQLNVLDGGGLLVIIGTSFVLLGHVFAAHDPNRWLAVGLLVAMLVASLLRDSLLKGHGEGACFAYAAVQTALIVALVLAVPMYYYAGFILFFRLGPETMMLFRPRVAYAWLGLFTLITLLILIWQEGLGGVLMLPVYFAGYVFFVLFARETARAQEARCESQRLLAELQEAHGRLQEYATQAEELAVTRERNRMAREVHDTLGHHLTVSAVQLQAAEKLLAADPQAALGMVGAVRGEVRAALDELRGTVAALR
ncbi:MAG TPA: histidine kinase, partial [Anaerolineae bacterium]